MPVEDVLKPTVVDKKNLAVISADPGDYPGGIVIPVDKPYRWTSTDVVRKIKFALRRTWNLKNVKIGHAGTLDPLATGILVVCIGKATKISEALQAERKEYIAQFTLGATTPSFDREHPVDEVFSASHIDIGMVRAAVEAMPGKIKQLPPVFSAKYINGKRSYELARSGRDAELKPAEVEIYAATLLGARNISGSVNFMLSLGEAESPECGAPAYCGSAYRGSACGASAAGDFFTVKKWKARADSNYEPEFQNPSEALLSPDEMAALPVATVRIACSKGTYIRSIARDFGTGLGSGAFMSALRRVASGGFKIADAVTFEDLLRIIPELSSQDTDIKS